MLETDADRLDAMQALGAETVTVDADSFEGIFDSEFAMVDGLETGTGSTAPVLLARDSDVAEFEIDRGVVLEIRGVDYEVVRLEADSTGMTRIVLKDA